jgi:hypothetical protein
MLSSAAERRAGNSKRRKSMERRAQLRANSEGRVESREQRAENREQRTENREQRAEIRE